VSRSAEDDWVLGEAEALLDVDGRRVRLKEVIDGLQSGEIRPVDHLTARERIAKPTRNHRNPVTSPAAFI
jgi:hypothetical protein